jgi:hypothetical protein
MSSWIFSAQDVARASLKKCRDKKGDEAPKTAQKGRLLDRVDAHEVFDEGVGERVERKPEDHEHDP